MSLKQLASDSWFCLTIALAIAFYFFDIGSDIKLAVDYFRNGDFWWAGWTTTFVALPWAVNIAIAMWGSSDESAKEDILWISAAILNLLPVAMLLIGMHSRFVERNKMEAHDFKSFAILFNLVEVVLEAFPQYALQLYVTAYSNQINVTRAISIATSLGSVIYNTIDGIFTFEKVWFSTTETKND